MNNAEISALITIPKIVTVAPRKQPFIQKGAEQYNLQLAASNDSSQIFKVFMRKHQKFEENFSIGLDFSPRTGDEIRLVRFNGYHEHQNKVGDMAQFEGFHIHRATEEALNKGLKSENFAIPSTDYATFEEAIIAFWSAVNIQDDYLKHFPFLHNLSQLKLQFPSSTEMNS